LCASGDRQSPIDLPEVYIAIANFLEATTYFGTGQNAVGDYSTDYIEAHY